MSNKVMMISILLVAVAAMGGVIWYVSRPGVVETEKIYVLPARAPTDSSLSTQTDPVDAPKQQDVINVDEPEASDRPIEKLEAVEEPSSMKIERQKTTSEEQNREEKEEPSANTLSVNDMEITRQHFQSVWQEKLDIGKKLLIELHEYKANIAEILSQPSYKLDKLIEVRQELHKTRNKLADVTVFFEDNEIIPIMKHFYSGYPKEVRTFLNEVEDFERELEAVYDN